MASDWQSILGVTAHATMEEVRRAYITMAAEAEAPGRFEFVTRAFLDYCQERLDTKMACGGIMNNVLEDTIRAAAKRGEVIRDPQSVIDEIEALRADVVWAVKHGAMVDEHNNLVLTWFVNEDYHTVLHDGTDAGMRLAVREARKGGRDHG